MQDFIDSYKVAFDIDKEVKLDSSVAEGEIKVTEEGYAINAKKDADVLTILGRIKLHILLNDDRVFNPTTELMGTILLAHQYQLMSKQLEVLEMDLLVEKLLIAKEDFPYDTYAVLKILGANPMITGADASQIDHYLSLELSPQLLDEIESLKE